MFRVTSVWQAPQGGPYYSTVFYSGTGATGADEARSATVALWGALAGYISSAYNVTVDPEVTELDPQTGAVTGVHTGITSPVVGTSTGQPLPFTTQGLLRLVCNTFVGSRRVRGRLFVPGLTENETPGGKPSTTFLTDANADILTWFNTIDVGNPLVVWSRPITGPDGRAGSEHEVASATFWDQFAVLRSRRD